jgi:hypothetical protein
MVLRYRSVSRRIAAATLCGACAWSVRAHAEAPTAKLTLARSAEAKQCMDERALRRSVESRLRRRVFRDDGELSLRVSLARRGSSWVAELELRDAAGPLGERSLSTEAAHCSALDDSLALVVALLVDTPPARPVAEPARVSPAERATESAPVPPAAPRVATPLTLPKETLAPREPWQFAARAGGVLLFGVLPGFAFGPGLGLGARIPSGPWFRLDGALMLPTERKTSDETRGVRVSAQRVGLLACGFSFAAGSTELEFCAGQRMGRIVAQGLGFDQSQRVERLYWAAVVGGELAFRLTSSVYVPVGLFVEIPLTRDQFVARDVAEPLYRVAPIAGMAAIALEFRGGS